MLVLGEITSRLEQADIRYCLVGGMAAIAYGRPRLTLDADLVLALALDDLSRMIAAFPIDDFYLPPKEVLLVEIQPGRKGHFNILHQHSALRADCYLTGGHPLKEWELAHRRRLQGPWGEAWFAPPESVILHKLLFYREGGSEKHLDDIRGMLETATPINQAFLEEWIERLQLRAEWNAAVG